MARPTVKQIKEQNTALLNDARTRVENAARNVQRLELELAGAKAVESEAQAAYEQLDKRLNPEQPSLTK